MMQLSFPNPFMRSFCSWVFFAVLFFTSQVTFANDLTIEETSYLESVSSETGFDVPSLSFMVNGLRASNASSGNITNDVSQILSILQSLLTTKSNHPVLYTAPTLEWASGTSLPLGLALLLSDKDNTSRPTHQDSYLYQIREILDDNSLLLEDVFGDIGGTTFREVLDDIDSHVYQTYMLLYNRLPVNFPSLLSSMSTNWWNEFRYSSGLWHSHVDDSQWNDLLDAIGGLQYDLGQMEHGFDSLNASTSASSLNVGRIYDLLQAWQSSWSTEFVQADEIGNYHARSLSEQIANSETNDQATIRQISDEGYLDSTTTDPEMPSYETASSDLVEDVDKDDLLDNLSEDARHGKTITLINSEDFQHATGVSGSMMLQVDSGRLSNFISDLSTITSTAYYGLLAVFSALLFWRKQTEISATINGLPRVS